MAVMITTIVCFAVLTLILGLAADEIGRHR